MRYGRMMLAWAALLGIGAIIGGTIGYGAYYRSDRYRRTVEAGLSDFFGLPISVNEVEPYSFTARRLRGLEMWLPQQRGRVFHCPLVIWDASGARTEDGAVRAALDIHNGVLSVGSKEWESEDYMRVLRASLVHNFLELNIRDVRFHDARFTWPREDFLLEADGVDGIIVFDDAGNGEAELTSRSLNGTTVAEPIRITARIDPSTDAFLPEVTLQVPTLPLITLGLDQVLQSQVTQGSFAGKITLRQSPRTDEIELTGFADDVRLEELTRRVQGGPLSALVNLAIERAVIRDRNLERIVFRGEVHKLQVDPLLLRFGLPQIGGQVDLTVYGGRVAMGRIERLSVAGQWVGGSLEVLARRYLGKTGVQGQLRLRVNTLVIENDEIVSGDVEVLAEPPPGGKGIIERSLLLHLVEQQLGVSLPENLLPAQIEYIQLGVRLLIDRRRLRVLSVHGPAGPAVVTARVFGQVFPLLGEMDLTLPIDPFLKRARESVGELKTQWPYRTSAPATTAPARPQGPSRPPQGPSRPATRAPDSAGAGRNPH